MSYSRDSAIIEVLATETTILKASAGHNYTIISAVFGNVDGTNDATVDIHFTKSGGSTINIVKTLSVQAGKAVEFLTGGKSSIFLESVDEFSATASAASDITCLVSYIDETE